MLGSPRNFWQRVWVLYPALGSAGAAKQGFGRLMAEAGTFVVTDPSISSGFGHHLLEPKK